MAIAEDLPLELWLIIFEMAFDPTNDPSSGCSHRNFPEIDFRLRSPWMHVPMDQLRQNLRLVSRTFYNMVVSSPQSILIESGDSTVPSRARSVCISHYGDTVACLHRLLAEPAVSSRIGTLVMALQFRHREGLLVDFDLLCDNAPSLPSIRRLTLAHHATVGTRRVENLWSRVNHAFPLLTCLVLGSGIIWSHEATPITFKKLEVLDVQCLRPAYRLRFPLLRHAAIGSFTNLELESFEHSTLLESMLVHTVHNLSRSINWRSFKQLRLLGMPLPEMQWIISFPPNHPLELLYVYIHKHGSKQLANNIIRMVKKMVICLPTVTQIHLDVETFSRSQQVWLERYLQGPKLKELGLHVRPLYSTRYQLVIERMPMGVEADSQRELVTLSGILRNYLSKLTLFGFHTQVV